MKVTFTDKWAAREGREADVTEAAADRLIANGYVEKGSGNKAPTEKAAAKPAKKASKAPAKKAASSK